jgi:hypothetical protein
MILHRKYSLLFQVILGIVCGLLNGVSNLQPLWKFPLYNDTIFTVLASFFGWVSGIVSAFTFHTIVPLIPIFETEGYLVFFFVFCSLSMVAIVQLYQRKKDRLLFIDLFILIFIITMVISLEGAFIFNILYKLFEYQEPIESKKITYLMLQQQIPLFLSAWFARVPVNLVDKTLAVCVGYYGALGLDKVLYKYFPNKFTVPTASDT